MRSANAPGVSAVLRRMLHLAPQRELPRLASQSFRQLGAQRRGVPDAGGVSGRQRDVILWADTFNNYFQPAHQPGGVRRADARRLPRRGSRASHLCCGRPLYDFGLLDQAKAYLRRILHALGPAIDAGCPIVVLEPSCASVFRDELRNLFPDDARAERLRRQTFLLSEFLEHQAPGYTPPQARAEGRCCTATVITRR